MERKLNMYDIIKISAKIVDLENKEFYKNMTERERDEFKQFVQDYTANALAFLMEDLAGDYDSGDEDADEFLENLMEDNGGKK